MSFNLTAGNARAHRIRVYYEGTDTIREGMPLCYNYLTTDNWHGGYLTNGAVTENGTTAEGSQNEGKYIRVIEPVVIDEEDNTPASSSKVITGDEDALNNIKVGHWVTVTGTDITNGTYKVTAVTAGTGGNGTDGTITLDMDDATGTTADVRVIINTSQWHAGAVAKGGWAGKTGPRALDIYVPNGAIIPIRTDKSCTIGESLGLGSDAYSAATGDSDPLACAVCMETVDRSSADGLVFAKVFDSQLMSGGQMFLSPVRGANTGYVYGVNIDGTKILRGVGVSKSYVMQISADKESAYAATGDSNDALLKITGTNYAANDSNYILRGLNVSINNGSGGTLGHIYNNISMALKGTSGNITNAIALQIDAQDLTSGTKTEFGGLDVAINREGTAATTEYGVQIRTRGTINTAMTSVFRVAKDAVDHGFVNLFDIETDGVDYVSCTGNVTVTSADYAIPILLNDVTHYLIAVDAVPSG